MGNMGDALIEELNVETVFTIPIFGGIPISESVVVTWIIMAALLLLSLWLTHGLKTQNITKRQAFAEF